MPDARRAVVVYLIVLAAFTAAAYPLSSRLGRSPVAALVVMWTPGLAALLASLFTRRPLSAIGWRPWPVKWLALGWALPILYAFPAYALVWLTGAGGVPSPTFLQRARFTLGMPTQPDWVVIVAAFGFITLVNLIPNTVLSLGEEIGWRGLLVPELARWQGFRRAALWSGVIWCAWHLPGVLTGAYGATTTPLAFRLACFGAMVVSSAVALAWLRLRSGSVWPAAIMHATHNGVVQAFFDRITADTGPTRYFIGEFGIAMVPFTVALAAYCWTRPGGSGRVSSAPQPALSSAHG